MSGLNTRLLLYKMVLVLLTDRVLIRNPENASLFFQKTVCKRSEGHHALSCFVQSTTSYVFISIHSQKGGITHRLPCIKTPKHPDLGNFEAVSESVLFPYYSGCKYISLAMKMAIERARHSDWLAAKTPFIHLSCVVLALASEHCFRCVFTHVVCGAWLSGFHRAVSSGHQQLPHHRETLELVTLSRVEDDVWSPSDCLVWHCSRFSSTFHVIEYWKRSKPRLDGNKVTNELIFYSEMLPLACLQLKSWKTSEGR